MAILEFFSANAPWGWIIAGLVLLGLELVIPGGFLLWLGIAGLVTGLAVFVQPLPLALQFGLFGILALVAIFVWLKFSRSRPATSDRPYLNRRADRFVGHEGVIDEPISAGYGRLALGDTVWRIAGPDLPAGTRVRVVSAEGAVLSVVAAG